MPEREHIEGMLRMLQKLQEAASGGGGQFAQRHAEQAQKYISEVSSRWAKKATNKENPSQQQEARREAKLEADRDNYKATNAQSLREAKRNLRDAVTAIHTGGRQIPDYLQPYVAAPHTATVARLIERVTIASDDLRNNPSFLIRESAKAYWGTNWMELTFDQAHQTHEVLDKVISRARNLAVQPITPAQVPDADARQELREHYDQIFLVTDSEYWQVFDYRTDIYRTEKLQDKDAAGNPLRGREKTRRDALDDVLLKEQKYLHSLQEHGLDFVKEKKSLENFQEVIARGVANNVYREEDARLYLEKIQGRLNELNQQLLVRERVTGRRETQVEEEEDILDPTLRRAFEARRGKVPPLTDAQKNEILNKIKSGELRGVAEEILNVPDRITEEELKSFFSRLDNAKLLEDYRRTLSQAGNISSEAVIKALDNDFEIITELKRRLRAKAIDLSLEAPRRSMWYEPKGEEAIKAINNTEVKPGITGRENSYDKIREEDLLALDEAFFKFLSTADNFPQKSFTEAFSWYKQADLEAFYGLLEDRLRQLHAEHPHQFTEHDISQVIERYTKMYELKEVYHNLIYLLEGASGDARDQVAKYLGTFKDEYADFMFKNVKGVKFALSLQESVIERIAADYDRRLPPDVMARNDVGESLWTKTYYDLMTELVKAAPRFEELRELQGMHEWQKKIAIEMAYGFSIADMQLPMKLTRVVGGRGYTSVWGETLKFDIIRGIFLKFKVPKPGVAMFYMWLTGDRAGAKAIRDSGEFIEKFEDLYYTAGGNENTIAGLRNFLDITSRFGPTSAWGRNHATREWTREQKKYQGFGFDINDAEEKAKELVLVRIKEDLQRKLGGQQQLENFEKNQRGRFEEHLRRELGKRRQEVRSEQARIIEEAFDRAHNLLPLVIARRWVDDKVFHKAEGIVDPAEMKDKRLDLLERVIRETEGGEEGVRRAMFGDPHGELVVHFSRVPGEPELAVRVDHPKDLWVGDPGNRDVEYWEQHLRRGERIPLEKSKLLWKQKVDEIEGALELVQQKALARIQGEIDRGGVIHDKLLSEDYDILQNGRLRRQAELYARLIKQTSTGFEVDDHGNFRLDRGQRIRVERAADGTSYLDRIKDRIIERKERYLISTVDVPWDRYKYVNMGGRGLVRSWIDANAVMAGGKGLMEYLEVVSVGKPKWEEALGILKKQVYNNIAMYWDKQAQEVSWTVLNGALNIFSENPWVTRGGLLGDIWNMPFWTDYLEKHNPRLLSALSQIIIAHDADVLGPNEKRRVIRMADNMNLLAKNPFAWGWNSGKDHIIPAEDYTARAMEKHLGATPGAAAREIIYYFPLALPLLMLFEGFREGVEEKKG